MGVTFQALRPMLRTNDMDGTVRFWTDRLGFTCDGLSEEDGWASLSRDGIGLMIATPNAHLPFKTPGFTGSFYFNVDDVAALWADLKDRVKSSTRWKSSITACASSRSTTTTATCCSSELRYLRDVARTSAALIEPRGQQRA